MEYLDFRKGSYHFETDGSDGYIVNGHTGKREFIVAGVDRWLLILEQITPPVIQKVIPNVHVNGFKEELLKKSNPEFYI